MLGHKSVHECKKWVSSREFTVWLAYFALYPLGSEAEQWRHADLKAHLANLLAPRRWPPYTAADFLPREEGAPVTNAASQLRAAFAARKMRPRPQRLN